MNRSGIATLVALGLTAMPALGDEFAVDWWTIDCGGAIGTVAGGPYALSGTIGQPDARGPMTGGAYVVQGGFWTGGMVVTSDVLDPDSDAESGAGSPGLAFRARDSAPNPFRALVTVTFELPSRQPVQLAIYDISGRLCRTLFDGGLDAGKHDLAWDARDTEGRTVASGIYFVVLQTPVGQHREKLVKVR
jgi:hypothetical protein